MTINRIHCRPHTRGLIQSPVCGLRDVAAPTDSECRRYAEVLKRKLDAFIGSEAAASHSVEVWRYGSWGVIHIDLVARNGLVEVHSLSNAIPVLRQTRELHIFVENRVYIFKPMHRCHWIESQADIDAGEVIGLVLDRARSAEDDYL